MNALLEKMVERVQSYQSNPPREDEVDGGYLLQLEILQSGVAFSEADVLEAVRAIGVPEGHLIDWMEEMASWVSDPEISENPRGAETETEECLCYEDCACPGDPCGCESCPSGKCCDCCCDCGAEEDGEGEEGYDEEE